MGSHFLLQGIFPTQGSNPGLLHCRQILYQLSYEGRTQENYKLKQWTTTTLEWMIKKKKTHASQNSNRNSHSLLVRMQNTTLTLKDSLAIYNKTKHTLNTTKTSWGSGRSTSAWEGAPVLHPDNRVASLHGNRRLLYKFLETLIQLLSFTQRTSWEDSYDVAISSDEST